MNESQRRIDKAEIDRLGKELEQCHSTYGKTRNEVVELKKAIQNLHEKISKQTELMRAQLAMHDGIVDTLQAELERQQPAILQARAFLDKIRQLEREVRSTDIDQTHAVNQRP
jgi:predicted  nucleic acid-binding Zn-ribbon protein